MLTVATILYSLSLLSSRAQATYTLAKEYSGKDFFTGWAFADGYDNTTSGAVNWLNQSAAASGNLVGFSGAGNPIIRIDNSTNLPDDGVVTDQLKRNSVEISTSEYFPLGSVFVFDAVHVPFGCSVWPAFWTRAVNWPDGGEIDVLESVNRATANQMTLHTNDGCIQESNVSQLGKQSGTNCSAGANGDPSVGCTVVETQANSFGEGFNDNGGGVWATQFDVTGINIWFWSRKDVPDSVSSATNTIDPSTWGEPSGAWPPSTCDGGLAKYFSAQQFVLDITLCGDFAGQPSVYQQTCSQPGVVPDANTCYIQNVNGTGSNYDEAYFEINYIKAFTVNGTDLSPTTSGGSTVLNTGSPAPTSTSSSNSSNSSTSDNKGGSNDAASMGSVMSITALTATVVAAFAWSML